jgi:hypothetical protein
MDARPSPQVRAARKRASARRWEGRGRPSKPERIQSLRRAQVLRLLEDRHGSRTLPDDDAGREYLQILFELGLSAPAAQRLAPWLRDGELERLINCADGNFAAWRKSAGRVADLIAARLNVTAEEKFRLSLHHIGCVDMDPAEVAAHVSEARRARQRRRALKRRQGQQSTRKVAAESVPQSNGGGQPVDPTDLLWALAGSSRPSALWGGLMSAAGEWWRARDLAREAPHRLTAFRGLKGESAVQAVHRALRYLEHLGVVELERRDGQRGLKELWARRPYIPPDDEPIWDLGDSQDDDDAPQKSQERRDENDDNPDDEAPPDI